MLNDKNRIFGLDALRAFAILSVVYGHGGSIVGYSINGFRYNYLVFEGVAMFFILSGFLIGRILLKTIAKPDFDGHMLADFWIRRWFRTLPNYFLVLLFLVSAFYFLQLPLNDKILPYFFFSQNIAWPHPDFFPEAWSLAVEEWFYLLIPIPLYISTKFKDSDRRKIILYSIIFVILGVTIFRIYRSYHFNYQTIGEWDLALRKQVVTRLDSLMFGVAGAYVSMYYPRVWQKIPIKLFIAGLILILCDKALSRNLVYVNYFSITMIAVGTLFLLPLLSSWRRPNDRLTKVVTFVSVISYSMYLLNLTPIQKIIYNLYNPSTPPQGQNSFILYAMYWIITFVLSYLMYWYFERHMTALRDKFSMKRKNTEPISLAIESSSGRPHDII